MAQDDKTPELRNLMARREFFRTAAVGTLVLALGGAGWAIAADNDPRTKEKRRDGRPRLPPGQRLLSRMKHMGGDPGDPSPGGFKLRVHGEVDAPVVLDFAGLLALPQTELVTDVHCVTGWSAFDVKWAGVKVAELARKAGVRRRVRHVIFEGAHGYSCNVPYAEATADNVLVVHKLDGQAIPGGHGAPVRGLVPDLYFWKSAKWLTGVRFQHDDEPGYWEQRGYHNHADPWSEERYG